MDQMRDVMHIMLSIDMFGADQKGQPYFIWKKQG
jgi:hypothetical protein